MHLFLTTLAVRWSIGASTVDYQPDTEKKKDVYVLASHSLSSFIFEVVNIN